MTCIRARSPHRAPGYPLGEEEASGLQRVEGCSHRKRLTVLPALRAAFSGVQQPQPGGIKAQSDHFPARAFQFLSPRFKVPQSRWLHPDITLNSDGQVQPPSNLA